MERWRISTTGGGIMEMGKWTPALLLSLTFLLGLSLGYIIRDTVTGDEPGWPPLRSRGPRPDGPPGGMQPELFERLAETLGLTEQQRNELDAILEGNRLKMMALRRGVQPRQRAISDSLRLSIENLLTPEQMRQFSDFRRGMRAGRPGPGRSGGGPRDGGPRPLPF